MTQQGITAKARWAGVPDATIQWTGQSSTSRSATIFTRSGKTAQADTSTTSGNDGETDTMRTRNKRFEVTFTAVPVGNAASDALAICADLPLLYSLATITCTDDDQIASPTDGVSVITAASLTYTPEGEAAIQFTVQNWPGKVFAAV